ncbi:2-C-methyl-D-erythritol 2,4-cyclodiphosphate synthase [Candidatus Neomarinimicrobiota bacterium]
MIKTGIGIDAHAFVDGQGFSLGGVSIPYEKSIVGHSDGDVIIHAIVDALLGAAAQGDIGIHFPSSDPQWEGASSRVFLTWTRELLVETDTQIQHVDCTVILQEPAISSYIPEMRRNVSKDLGIDIDQVSIKATTTDQLGFTGRKEGIAAMALATIAVQEE